MPSPAPVDNAAFDKLHIIQKDWAQREWIEAVNGSMKRIVDFLNKFGMLSNVTLDVHYSQGSALSDFCLPIFMAATP
jgi:hypothetical protein